MNLAVQLGAILHATEVEQQRKDKCSRLESIEEAIGRYEHQINQLKSKGVPYFALESKVKRMRTQYDSLRRLNGYR